MSPSGPPPKITVATGYFSLQFTEASMRAARGGMCRARDQPGQVIDLPDDADVRRVNATGLGHRKKRSLKTHTRGMQQRMAIALTRTLLHTTSGPSTRYRAAHRRAGHKDVELLEPVVAKFTVRPGGRAKGGRGQSSCHERKRSAYATHANHRLRNRLELRNIASCRWSERESLRE